ncbi:MAG: putative triple gene block protein 2 [Beijing sediment alphaflexivirus]|nr:MAG: putative triple gene block protein 2 [Beijing sediment alphaflexivirus]
MPLTPPPDYTKPLLAAIIGIALAGTLQIATRNTLPYVGDNIHALPHGGTYCDGTKSVSYHAPGTPREFGKLSIIGIIFALVAAIAVSSRHPRHSVPCSVCNRAH